jgi:hypothetical protein
MANTCPMCQKDDLVQRVETLVSAGQSSGTFSGPSIGATYSDGKLGSVGGYTTLSGSTSSNLAKLLEPPSSPPEPKGYGCWWILLVYPVIPILSGFIGSPLIIPGAILLGNENPIKGFFGGALLVVGFIIGLWLAITFFVRKERKKKAGMQEIYSLEKPKWDIAIQRWKRLYYCHRDGIVYDPDTGDSCAPALVKDFVYR